MSVRPHLVLYLILFPLVAMALGTDTRKPIHIQADRIKLNEKTGISEYTGNVKLTQGTIDVNADKITVIQSSGELEKILIEGTPARFHQKPDGSNELINAQAKNMEYLADKRRLYLHGDAVVIQGPNRFSGDRIEYDTYTSTVTAHSSSQQPVDVILHPDGGKTP